MAPMTFLAIGLPFCGSLAVARSKARLSNLISQCGGSNRNISRFSPGANSAVNVTCEPRASDPAAHWPRRHPYKTSQISMSSKGKLCKTLQLWKFRSVQILHLANSFCVQIGLHFHHLEQWSPYLCFPSRPASPTRYAMCHRALASSHAFNAKICTAISLSSWPCLDNAGLLPTLTRGILADCYMTWSSNFQSHYECRWKLGKKTPLSLCSHRA